MLGKTVEIFWKSSSGAHFAARAKSSSEARSRAVWKKTPPVASEDTGYRANGHNSGTPKRRRAGKTAMSP